MRVLRSRNAIDKRSSANQRIASREVHNQFGDQLRLVWVRQGRPGRARVGAVDRHLAQALALSGRDAGCELTREVQEETL